MQPRQVFILTQFDADGQRVQDAVRDAMEEAGFRVVQVRDAVRPGAEMTLSILESIREADLIIADVSHQNPNVLYEMGFAHALRKPTILLLDVKSGSRLPSDLDGLQYITYDRANIRGLADRLKAETRAVAAPRA